MDKDTQNFFVDTFMRVISDDYFKRLVIYSLYKLAKRTDNDLDDRICEVVTNLLLTKKE